MTLVPSANFAADLVDELNIDAPAMSDPVTSDELGPDAVSFPGTVGIGSAPSGGATVGFVKDGAGVLVAVRSGEEGGPSDLGTATRVAEEVAGGL